MEKSSEGLHECHTVRVVTRAVQEEVLWCVWLCWAPGAVWAVSHAQSMQVCIEVGVSNPQPGDGSVKGLTGEVGLPVASCVLSDVT